jgi:hypothetical protein
MGIVNVLTAALFCIFHIFSPDGDASGFKHAAIIKADIVLIIKNSCVDCITFMY